MPVVSGGASAEKTVTHACEGHHEVTGGQVRWFGKSRPGGVSGREGEARQKGSFRTLS